jgi:formiminotetrahydrofolate cyclodeaminase
VRLSERTVTDLLAAFRSPDPTPGGGSASALAGAVGASLLAMVAALPKTRASAAADEDTLREAGRQCAALSTDLTSLIDRDSEAYDLVMSAYQRPKGTDEEKAARSAAIQSALRSAIAAPLDVMRACADAAEKGIVIADFGNPSAASDVQVALELLAAALRGARLNVEINLESVKDPTYIADVREEITRLGRRVTEDADAARNALRR